VATSASNASREIETGPSTSSTSAPAARPQVDVVAITLGDDLLIDLGEALAGQATVSPVDTAAAAVDQIWSSRRGQVLVVDTRDLADVRGELQQAVTQAPHAVVLLFVPAGQEAQAGEQVKGLPVQAILPIPLDRRRTTPVLSTALADAAARGPGERRLVAAPQESNPQPGSALTLLPEPRSKVGLWVGLALAAAAAGGGGYWYLQGGSQASVTQQPVTAAPATEVATTTDPGLVRQKLEIPLVAGKLDDLLEKGRQAMRGFHYMEPEKDSAMLYYRSALSADPSNAEAKDGLQRIGTWGLSRFEEALGKGRFEDAATTLSGLRQVLPGDARLAELEQRLTDRQMARLVSDGNFEYANKLLQREAGVITPEQEQKYRAEITHRSDEMKVARVAGQIETAIHDGRLLDPADDSAHAYVQQLLGPGPKTAQAQRAIHDLIAALLRRARDSKSGTETERFLQEARSLGVAPGEIDGLRHDIAQARQKAESDRIMGLFHDRLRDGKLIEPPIDSAATYLGQLQSADPGAYVQASRELAAKLLERARTSYSQGKSVLAEADLNQARKFGADPKDVAALQQQEASRAAAALAAVHAAASSAGDSAAVTGTAVPKLLRYAKPEFPQKALQQNVGGSVTVQFVIDVNGDPRDVRVVEATPPGIFDRAALAAVKRWHFQPTVVDGKRAEVPVQMPIRFPKPE
jgi:protein TonB